MFIAKRSNGIYYLYYDEFGKRKPITTKSRSKSEALKFLHKFMNEKDARESNIYPIQLKPFIFNFLKYSESIHKEKTSKSFKNTFNFLFSYFGNVFLREFNEKKITEYLSSRINTSSVFQARKDLINLKSAFNWAVNSNYLVNNPANKIKQIKIPEKLPLFFSKSEFSLFINSISDSDFKDLIILAVNTGMRQMELLFLRWEQIDFFNRMIILDNRNNLTKNNKIRNIPLNHTAFEIIAKRRTIPGGCFVFEINNQPYKQVTVVRKFKILVRKVNINPKLHFHSLRHTFASWLVQQGTSIYHVSKLLGHSDIKTTQIYAHLSPDNLKSEVEKIQINLN